MLDNTSIDYYVQFNIHQYLNNLANSESFWETIESIYGTKFDRCTAQNIRSQWQQGDFSGLPTVSILPNNPDNLLGAYSQETNTIYLNDRLDENNTISVLLEEIGHWFDDRIKDNDNIGDEGELFAAIVREIDLSAIESNRIKNEDDRGIIKVLGDEIEVEKGTTITLTVTTTADQNDSNEADGLSLREAILKANVDPNNFYVIQLLGTNYQLTAQNKTGTTGELSGGDLDILGSVFIRPQDISKIATIDASTLPFADRVFEVAAGGALGMAGIIVTGGNSTDKGGGIYNKGILTAIFSNVSNNKALNGAGIYSA